MSNKAIFIKEQVSPVGAMQEVYRLSPPADSIHEHVVVSAVAVPFTGAETYIFPGESDGTITDFMELEGSYRGGLDHEHALRGLGYEVVGK